MKTIQCAHPPHHHNGFVAICRLWTASGGVHALLVLEPTECSTSIGKERKYINKNKNCFMTHRGLNKHKARSVIHIHDFTIYVLRSLLCAC